MALSRIAKHLSAKGVIGSRVVNRIPTITKEPDGLVSVQC